MADCELFRSRGARLFLVEGDERMLLQSGDFVVVLVKNSVSQLAVIVAMVGEVQWPVGRDSAVAREGEASFSFSLPGPLTYSLVLGSTASAADVQRLEKVVGEYSACAPQQAAAAGEGLQADIPDPAPAPAPAPSKKRTGDEVSLQMVGRMQRARRMSAVTKVFSKSLVRGAISAANHVEPMDMAAPDSTCVGSSQALPSLAFAGVDAVAKVVEAVETGGRTFLETAGSAAAGSAATQGSRQAAQAESGSPCSHVLNSLISSGWRLNKLGLLTLFRVISASMAMHNRGSSSSGSSRSGSSSSSEFRRLLSSSSSSSSFSSRSPTTPSHLQGGADATSRTAFQPPLTVGAATSPSPPPLPPPPPLFTSQAPRVRHSDMPPPSGPPPPNAAAAEPSDSLVPTAFRIFRPRATPAVVSSAPSGPPPFLPRPPGCQPPPQK